MISKLLVINHSLKTANLVIILFKGFACRSLSLVEQGVADFKPVSILFPLSATSFYDYLLYCDRPVTNSAETLSFTDLILILWTTELGFTGQIKSTLKNFVSKEIILP